MLFNSIAFFSFLPIVFIIYWGTAKNLKLQNLAIVLASAIFYGWWDWRFLGLLYITTILSFTSGLLLGKTDKESSRRWICGINILLNLLILGFFKYYNFFTENIIEFFKIWGYEIDSFTLQVVLPVGISFYTFQALSYSIDVYRRQINPAKDFLAFASFISFFPQLVAGPIEQAKNLLPQFEKPRVFKYNNAVQGMRQILWGFFKKLIIADNCATLADGVFNNYQVANGSMLILGAFFFSFQIYGDFSGYSDIALGTARLFSIELRKNFNLPYFSRDITEFWRRWHISLNQWFIQYVYIPLGGSRCKRSKNIRNIIIVFLLSGLWHGANWTFIAWGLYNGLLLSIMVFFHHNYCDIKDYHFLPPFRESLQIIGTFIIVMIGWVIFRAASFHEACQYLSLAFTQSPLILPNYYTTARLNPFLICSTLVFIMILLLTEWGQRDKDFALDLRNIHNRACRWSIYIIFILCFCVFSGGQAEFIYFQF